MSHDTATSNTEKVLALYHALTGSDLPGTTDEPAGNAIEDMLADLMHFCDAKGLDFADRLDIACMHYDAEIHEVSK